MCRSFRTFDVDGTGFLTTEQLQAGPLGRPHRREAVVWPMRGAPEVSFFFLLVSFCMSVWKDPFSGVFFFDDDSLDKRAVGLWGLLGLDIRARKTDLGSPCINSNQHLVAQILNGRILAMMLSDAKRHKDIPQVMHLSGRGHAVSRAVWREPGSIFLISTPLRPQLALFEQPFGFLFRALV